MTQEQMRQYAERDPEALDAAGGYYIRHVSAMTSENLDSKRQIAAELAFRDMIIDQLRNRGIEAYAHARYAEKDIDLDDVVLWADGTMAALGTELAGRVTEQEAAIAARILDARYAPTMCSQHRPDQVCPNPESCRDNGCSAVEREVIARYAGGGEAVAWRTTDGEGAVMLWEKRPSICSEDMHEYEIIIEPLYTHPPAPVVPEIDELAQFIRTTDGRHDMGAGRLAEKIVEWLSAAQEQQVPPVVPEGYRLVSEYELRRLSGAMRNAKEDCDKSGLVIASARLSKARGRIAAMLSAAQEQK